MYTSVLDSGIWSTEGCSRDENMSTDSLSVCRCNHLTHFGILMQVKDMPEVTLNTYSPQPWSVPVFLKFSFSFYSICSDELRKCPSFTTYLLYWLWLVSYWCFSHSAYYWLSTVCIYNIYLNVYLVISNL